jgi:DNA polymerase
MHELLSVDALIREDAVAAAIQDVRDRRQHVLHRDGETRSLLSLKAVGAHRYASDINTSVLCYAYALDNGPVKIWKPGDPIPPEFVEAASNPAWVVVAHNDSFETAIEQHIMGPRFGWPVIPLERHHCTMTMAAALGLPASLDAVAEALSLADRKDVAGARLMLQMCKPRRPRQGEDPQQLHWFDDAERLQRLYAYCRQDVEVERELFDRLPPLSEAEHRLWQLSGRINDRGFYVDRQLAEAARRIAQAAAPEIDAELAALTSGAVTGIAQVARLQAWLQQQGCTTATLDRKAIERQLENDALPSTVRRVLELRLGGAQAAVKKIDALLQRAGADNRVRGAFITAPLPAVGPAKECSRKT